MEESTATAGGSRDRIDVHQVLGTSLDGLVRAFRSGNTVITPKIAERLFDLWNEVPKVMLVLDATTLSINEQVILKAEDNEGRWLLPAFMAGLRILRRQADCSLDDFLRLGEELAALTSNLSSITLFQDGCKSETDDHSATDQLAFS